MLIKKYIPGDSTSKLMKLSSLFKNCWPI